jgi:hypothetical protein
MTPLQPADARPARPRRLSEVLTTIANDPGREFITVADIRDAMGDRAFGAMMFVFAAPNALPLNMLGISAVLGVPLLFLALQFMFGIAVPWLPRALVQRQVQRGKFARVMNHVVPWVRRAERLLKPRISFLAEGPVERLMGLLCVVLSLVLILPIPLGNVPPAAALCVLSLGLLERDGVAVALGMIGGVASIVLASGVIMALVKAVSLFVGRWLGL